MKFTVTRQEEVVVVRDKVDFRESDINIQMPERLDTIEHIATIEDWEVNIRKYNVKLINVNGHNRYFMTEVDSDKELSYKRVPVYLWIPLD